MQGEFKVNVLFSRKGLGLQLKSHHVLYEEVLEKYLATN